MAKRDYYEVLEIPRNASADDVKRSYRKLAFKYHPDRNKNDKDAEVRFKEAAEAYEVLSDDQKRQIYDKYGHEGLQGAAGGGPRGFSSFEDIFSAFGDIFGGGGGGGGSPFDEMFGFGRSRGGPQRGASLKAEIELTLDEVDRGVEKEIEVKRAEPCATCSGSGAKPGTHPKTCSQCGGHGQVQISQGFFAIRQVCPKCRGAGSVIDQACTTCRGQGKVPKKRTLTVRVPAGVPDGVQLRVAGEGEVGPNNGPRGDLYCFVRVKEHAIFQRDGDDLVCEMPITFTQAALGAEVEIPTLGGKTKLEIPRGTQSGKVFELDGLGLKNVQGYSRGNLLVRVVVEVPRKLSPRQEELLREFAEGEEANANPRRKSFLDKVRELFDS